MTGPERYHLVAPLPPLGGWRRTLALDRRGGQAGPVVLSFAPMALVEDPARLAVLSRDAEAGARVHHPHVLSVLGLEAVEDQLAMVEPYRAGTPLRALLDVSGRLPVDLAVRITCDAAAGLAALHGLAVGDGQLLAHGALSADRILVAEDGTSLLTGVGTGGGRSVAEDVRALAAVLVEMLTGEVVAAGAKLELAGTTEALAAVVEGAREDAFPHAAAFADALRQAHAPAAVAAVAVYVGAVTPAPQSAPPPVIPAAPPGTGLAPASMIPPKPPPVPEPPAATASTAEISPPSAGPGTPTGDAPEVSAELIAPSGAGPEVSAELIAPGRLAARARPPEPTGERTPPPDAAITFPAPPAAASRRGLPRAPILAAVAIAGLALGFGISRLGFGGREPRPAARMPAAPPAQPAPATSAAPPAEALAPASPARSKPPPAALAAATEAKPTPAEPHPAPPRKPPSISVTATPPAEIYVDGKAVGRAPLVVEVTAGEHEVRLRDRAQGVDARRRVQVKGPVTPVRFQLARGKLEVTAPADTEVYVDGRRVGMGSQTVDLWEGAHEVEARRGSSRVKERFELTQVVTRWTYNVTPTP